MATTLHNRVEDYIGGHDVNMEQADWLTAISEWLTASAREIFEVIPLQRLKLVSPSPASIPWSGLSLSGKRIVSVDSGGYPCREVSASILTQVKDPNSIHYATTTDPVFYTKAGSIYTVVNGTEVTGTLHYIESPLLDYDQTEISNFPSEFETLVILGTAIRGRIRQLGDRRAKLKEYIETDEDTELAGAVSLEIQAMQGELQALQENYNREFQLLVQGMQTP